MKTSFFVANCCILLAACSSGSDTDNSAGDSDRAGDSGSNQNSTGANLSALSFSAGVLSPSFAPNTLAYSASVATPDTVGHLSATTVDASATSVVTTTSSDNPLTSVSGNIFLPVGGTSISIVVTASNGTTQKTYTITATRAAGASSNANLSELDVGQQGVPQVVLSPTFDPSITSYTATVGNAVTSLIVAASREAGAMAKVNGEYITSE